MRMRWTIVRAAFALTCALALSLALPICVAAQVSNEAVVQDTALLNVVFRAAFREGLYTAHADARPELVCVGIDPNPRFEGGHLVRPLVDPPASVVTSLQEGRSTLVRPRSACVLTERATSYPRTSRVQDTISGKRGIFVTVNAPEQLADSTLSVRFSYYEHEVSAGWWKCTVRKRTAGWEVVRCEMLGIS